MILRRERQAPDGRKVKGTIHWVSVDDCIDAQVNLYDHLFKVENPDDYPEGEDYKVNLNENSITVLKGCKRKKLARCKKEDRFQFVRMGYFCLDDESKPHSLVFNRTVTLKDTWAKIKEDE